MNRATYKHSQTQTHIISTTSLIHLLCFCFVFDSFSHTHTLTSKYLFTFISTQFHRLACLYLFQALHFCFSFIANMNVPLMFVDGTTIDNIKGVSVACPLKYSHQLIYVVFFTSQFVYKIFVVLSTIFLSVHRQITI